MKDKEIEARKLCAYCNFSKDCEECSHIDWPNGNWLISSQFDWKKCNEWRYYLKQFKYTRLQIVKNIFESLLKHG